MENGDIYTWAYKPEFISDLKMQSGTTYWCCSRIGVFNNGLLVDTYWGSSGENISFTIEDANNRLCVTFVANEADLLPISRGDRVYYEDKDVIDLTHPNSYGGKIYIIKGTEKSLRKMKFIQQKLIDNATRKFESAKRDFQIESELLEKINIDAYVFANSDISHFDNGDWSEE